MKIATHPFHRAIEYYWLSLFPEHEFQFVASSDLPSDPEGMPIRPHPPNYHLMTTQKGCDFAVAHTLAGYRYFKDKLPTIMWFHHLPYGNNEYGTVPVAVYLTHEAKEAWGAGFAEVVAYHPIDVFGYHEYVGDIPKFINVATMPMTWWGEKKGVSTFNYLLEEGVDIKLIGSNNENDYPDCEPELVVDQRRLKYMYRHLRGYTCTSPQIERSPLEALATGMPVIIKEDPRNTLVEEVGDLCYFVSTDEEFAQMCRVILNNDFGDNSYKNKDRIWKIFRPEQIRARWEESFDLIIRFGDIS